MGLRVCPPAGAAPRAGTAGRGGAGRAGPRSGVEGAARGSRRPVPGRRKGPPAEGPPAEARAADGGPHQGGVGKTTTSCCLAVQMAKVRGKVLLISTDPAHNLSDAFQQKFHGEPSLVDGFDNLFAMEVDPEQQESAMQAQVAEGEDGGFLAELAGSIPGVDEAMSFAEVMKQVQTMDYDIVVFDTAPTGHTLRLLQFPTILNKALDKILGLKGMFGGLMSQVMTMFGAGMEGGQEDMMEKLEEMKTLVEAVNNQFRDPDLTTFVCVCIPEFLSLYETERLVQELVKNEIDTRNIVINQLLFPEKACDSRLLLARLKMQRKYLDQFDDLYEDFHIVKMPLLEEEIRGVPALRSFGQHLVRPYVPPAEGTASVTTDQQVAALQEEIARLRAQLQEAQEG